MSVMNMMSVSLIGPRREMESAAMQMLLTGGLQPIPIDTMIDDRGLRARISTDTSDPCTPLIARLASVWRASGETPPDPVLLPLDPDLSYEAVSDEIGAIVSDIDRISARRDEIRSEIERLNAARAFSSAMRELGISPSVLDRMEYAVPIFGRMSAEESARVDEASVDAPMMLIELSRAEDSVWAVVFAVTGYEDAARSMLKSVTFEEHPISELVRICSGDDAESRLDETASALAAESEKLAAEAGEILSSRRQYLEETYSKLCSMQRVRELCRSHGEIGEMYVLSGWMPISEYEALAPKLEEIAPQTTVIAEPVDAEHSGAPTELGGGRFLRSFHEIVKMYSLPSYGELDPAPFVALTFILFFGFMFGDIGHGALLFIGSHVLSKRGILKPELAFVMKCASVSSMIFGVLYGSVMGVEDIFPPVWLSPMHDIGTLFGTSIAAGAVMISVGMVLNIMRRWRERDYGKMLFDGQGAAGLLLYLSAALAACSAVTGASPLPVPASALWGFAGAMLVVMIARGLLTRALFGAQEEEGEGEGGAMAAFEVLHTLMNFFTNTASFVRLAAFALNHVALSFAIMLISDMLGGLPGGPVLKGLMLVVGNLFIVGLEGMIVFIQVLRLEYYEFFSKFYKGGGVPFRPVSWGGGAYGTADRRRV